MYGLTRQAYYSHLRREWIRSQGEEFICELVRCVRHRLSTCGGRNLWKLVQRFLRLFGYPAVGRDRFFSLIRKYSLWVKYPKRSRVKTTYTGHGYAVRPNYFSGLEVTLPGQAFVADITYIPLMGKGNVYLFLITDAFSRMIVGHYVSDSLEHDGAEVALRRAKRLLGDLKGAIHHTDRGIQYCCHDFLDCLGEHGLIGSMTDKDHCAQNALAKRMNGILKREYGCDLGYEDLEHARAGIQEAVQLYNYYSIHGSLDGRTPAEVHFGEDHTIELWAKQILPRLPQTTCRLVNNHTSSTSPHQPLE